MKSAILAVSAIVLVYGSAMAFGSSTCPTGSSAACCEPCSCGPCPMGCCVTGN